MRTLVSLTIYTLKLRLYQPFGYLRNIAKPRGYAPRQDLQKLIYIFISCRVDYSNAPFIGLPKTLLDN